MEDQASQFGVHGKPPPLSLTSRQLIGYRARASETYPFFPTHEETGAGAYVLPLQFLHFRIKTELYQTIQQPVRVIFFFSQNAISFARASLPRDTR